MIFAPTVCPTDQVSPFLPAYAADYLSALDALRHAEWLVRLRWVGGLFAGVHRDALDRALDAWIRFAEALGSPDVPYAEACWQIGRLRAEVDEVWAEPRGVRLPSDHV